LVGTSTPLARWEIYPVGYEFEDNGQVRILPEFDVTQIFGGLRDIRSFS